jgi:hypothetical protein
MKKILLLALLAPLSMWAQKKTALQSIITDSTERLVFFTQDTTFKNTVTADFVKTYELTSPESFSIRPLPIDAMTTDSLCESIGILTLQAKFKVFKKGNFKIYQKISAINEPEVKAIDAQIKALQEERAKIIEGKKAQKANN